MDSKIKIMKSLIGVYFTALLVVLMALSNSVASQGLRIYDLSGNDISGSTISVSGNALPNSELFKRIRVMSADTALVFLIKSYVSIVENNCNYFVWNSCCYPPNAFESSPEILYPGTYSDTVWFHYLPDGNCGSSTIVYSIADANNLANSVSLTIIFIVTSVSQVEKQYCSGLNVYPNPAIDFVSVDFPGCGNNYFIDLLNLRGITSRKFNRSSKNTTLDVSSLPKGIWHIMIRGKNEVLLGRFLKL